jgi:hypothetical protein
MQSPEGESVEVLCTDRRGRVRMSSQRRAMLLEEFDRSGASAPDFAKTYGIKYQTLSGWLLRRRKNQAKTQALPIRCSPSSSIQFAEVVVPAKERDQGSGDSTVIVELPGGARMCLRNPQQSTLAAAVILALEPRRSDLC